MTTESDSSAVPATTDRITELLAEHEVESLNRGHVDCTCGWTHEPTPKADHWTMYAAHRVHVASLLAVLVADAQTDAWDKSCDHHYREGDALPNLGPGPCDDNPYRSGESEKLQQQINAPEGEEHAGSDKVVGTHTPHTTPNPSENP